MKDIELPPRPDPKYIYHDADDPGEADLYEFEFAGAVDGRYDICERLYTGDQLQAYARAAVEANSVPDGWKLVPVEPTEAMVQKALHLDLSYMPGHEGPDRAAVYRAMLSASPAPAQQERTVIGYVPMSAVEETPLDGYVPVYGIKGQT